jgi:hypothetical protein
MRTKAFRRTQDVQRKLRAMQVLKTCLNGIEPTAKEIGLTTQIMKTVCSMCKKQKSILDKTSQEQALESIKSVLRDVI